MRTETKTTLSAAILLIVVVATYSFWLSRPVAPVAPVAYYGILLDKDGKAEVNYKLGDPDFVDSDFESHALVVGAARALTVKANAGDPNALPEGRDFKSYNRWGYKSHLWVTFRKSRGTVSEVQCYSPDVHYSECEPLLDIHIGDTEESVTNRLGPPSDAILAGRTKVLSYLSLNVMVFLARERVYTIAMGLYEKVK